jgi:predicted lactoylglutathione lyase
MARQIFVNLPVADIKRSNEFVKALGFEINPQFSGEDSVCVVVSDTIYFMLLSHKHFQGFSPKPICDTSKSLEVLTCLSLDSREEVDEIVRKAVAAGGSTYKEAQDMGFMYGHGFLDPDGHVWEVIHMDMSKFPSE